MADKKEYIYGRHPVTEALRRNPKGVKRLFVASAGRSGRLASILRLATQHNIQVVEVAKRTLVDLAGDVTHQSIIALVEPFRYVDVETLLTAAEKLEQAPLLVALKLREPEWAKRRELAHRSGEIGSVEDASAALAASSYSRSAPPRPRKKGRKR